MSSISAAGVSSAQFNPQFANASRRGGPQGPGGAQFKEAFSAAAEQAGVDPADVPDLQAQIEAALKKSKESGSGDSRQDVQSAIDEVLKQNGVDPSKFHEAMKAQMEKLRGERNGGQPQVSPADEAVIQAGVDGEGAHVDTFA